MGRVGSFRSASTPSRKVSLVSEAGSTTSSPPAPGLSYRQLRLSTSRKGDAGGRASAAPASGFLTAEGVKRGRDNLIKIQGARGDISEVNDEKTAKAATSGQEAGQEGGEEEAVTPNQ